MTVDMTVTVLNDGHRDATGITGVLSTASPHITILEDQATFPDVAAGNTGESQPPAFQFEVASDAPDQQPVTFNLALSETGSGHAEVLVFDVMISSCATTPAVDVPKPISDNSTSESTLDYLNAIEIGDPAVVDIPESSFGS